MVIRPCTTSRTRSHPHWRSRTPAGAPELLPEPLRRFADGGHGGSHPHLVHEFVSSIVENRAPRVDARTAATWTAPGICAHQSALRGGVEIQVPDYGDQ